MGVICILLLLSTAKAGKQQQSFKQKTVITDILPKKDSLPQALTDPKQGFQNLFVTSTLTDGINIEQMNPLAISFVQDYMDKFGKSLVNMKSWGKPYFDMMDGILTQHGLPKELKYLAVIESYLKSNAKSWVGAVGPWQFMPETARSLGLRVSEYYDERTDYFKSTHAACRYLTDLFSIYGDWLLVIAAYNGGPGNVNNAIRKSGSRDFWSLQYYLPVESKNHVKKFIATHYIMEGQGGVTTSTKDETEARIQLQNTNTELALEDTIEVKSKAISGRYNSLVVVKYLAMGIADFNRLNPDFDQRLADIGTYEMRLPADKMDAFLPKKLEILYESIQLLLKPGPADTPHR
jgi:membrane-bound lytic murein transglycosylase D